MTKQLMIELTDEEYELLQQLCSISKQHIAQIKFKTTDPIYDAVAGLHNKGLVIFHHTTSRDDGMCWLSPAGIFVMHWQFIESEGKS